MKNILLEKVYDVNTFEGLFLSTKCRAIERILLRGQVFSQVKTFFVEMNYFDTNCNWKIEFCFKFSLAMHTQFTFPLDEC